MRYPIKEHKGFQIYYDDSSDKFVCDIEIMRIMDDKVSDNYSEQTLYGNVYNYFIEFVMANPFVIKCTFQNDKESLRILKAVLKNRLMKQLVILKTKSSLAHNGKRL